MKKTTRFLATALTLSMLAAGLAGCGSTEKSGTPATGDSDKTLLKVQMVGSFQLADGTDPISGAPLVGFHAVEEEFEKQHPDIDLEYVFMGWDDYQKKTQTMLMGGECDVYQCPGIAALADQGLLEPLQSYIDRDSFDLGVYIDGQVDGWKVAGHGDEDVQIYGLPLIADTRTMIYDKQLFDDWGVDYLPEHPTYEEVLAAGKQTTGVNPVTGEQNYGIFFKGPTCADYAMNLNEYFGGTWGSGIRSAEMTMNLNTDTMIKAVNALKELNQYAPVGAMNNQGCEKFGTDKNDIAIHIGHGPTIVRTIHSMGLDDRYGIARIYVNEEHGVGGVFQGSPICIAQNSENKDAAWEYIKFTSSPFFAQYFWENQPRDGLPCVKAALEFDGVKNNENMSAVMDTLQYLWAPRYIYSSNQGNSILTTAVEDVVLNNVPAEQALEKAQHEVDEWIAMQ